MSKKQEFDYPDFNNARGMASSLQSAPPFGFTDTTMCVFPIRVNTSRLQQFIDSYLNQSSDVTRFEAFIPYIYFMVIDYGKMSIEAANMGWVSQTEVAFGVPLRWMVKRDNEWVFHDWAFNCPFIYVDNELSMMTGREVYGWPKSLVTIVRPSSEWIKDPNGEQQVFEISTSVIQDAYQGQEAASRPFITVSHEPNPSLLDIPLDLTGLLKPMSRLPSMMMDAARFSIDVASTFSGTMLQGVTGSSSFPNLLNIDVLKKLRDGDIDWLSPNTWEPGVRNLLWSLYPRLAANTINLKQFRDASHPWLACYQAINNSQMGVESLNGGGALGPQNVMLGQFDGGYSIDIHRYANLPVTDALGIEVESTRNQGGSTIETIRPTFPFWIQTDMSYGRGKTVSSRMGKDDWAIDDEFATANDFAKSKGLKINPDESVRYLFNTARGNAAEELSGPFELPDSTVRVLPLIADQAKLDAFVGEYLLVEGESRCEAWGNYVYLVATSYTLSPETNNVGLFPGKDVQFRVPIKRYAWYEDEHYELNTAEGRNKRDKEKFLGVAFVTAFSYVDDSTVAITSSEVNGVPTLHSAVASPQHTWMDSSGPAEWVGQRLLDTSALVLPAVGVGAGGSHEKFLEIGTDEFLRPEDDLEWRNLVDDWGSVLCDDLEKKHRQRGKRDEQKSKNISFRRLRGWAIKLMTGQIGLESLALKQFRDSWEPDKACYQGIVQGRTTIEQFYELNEIEEPLHVCLKRYPTQPVVELLGLKVKYRKPGTDTEILEPVRPFWLRADLKQELGDTIYERGAGKDWQAKDEKVDGEAADKELDRTAKQTVMAHSGTLNHVDRVHVPDLGTWFNALSEVEKSTNTRRFSEVSLKVTGTDVGAVDPATIIDSILSRQWARPAERRKEIHKPDFCVSSKSFGPYSAKLYPESEQQDGYWPQSEDQEREEKNLRMGLQYQLWRNTWELIEEEQEEYVKLAEKTLPKFFHHGDEAKPWTWTEEKWREIAEGMKELVKESHYQVDWATTIRPINTWASKAAEFSSVMSEGTKPDAASGGDDDESPGKVLRERIRNVLAG